MNTGTTHHNMATSGKKLVSFVNNEQYKYSLDNPITLKFLSNIRTTLDQHSNFLLGLAATASMCFEKDLKPSNTLTSSLFILQHLSIPIKIMHELPTHAPKAIPIAHSDAKNKSVEKTPKSKPVEIAEARKAEPITTQDTPLSTHATPTKTAAVLPKPSRKAVAFYAEVDQEVEEIRKRLLSSSPQPKVSAVVNGIPKSSKPEGNYLLQLFNLTCPQEQT